MFTWADGTFIHPDVLTRTIRRLSVAAGLPALTPHGLRHTLASAALSARVPVEVVAARLGNMARVAQEVFAHVIPADDGAAAQLVGDLYRTRPHMHGLCTICAIDSSEKAERGSEDPLLPPLTCSFVVGLGRFELPTS